MSEIEVNAPFEVTWDSRVVPVEALDRALYALADQVTGTVEQVEQRWTMTCHPRHQGADQNSLGHLLRQEVNDQALRLRIAERTDPIRSLIFAVAFSKSGLVQGQAAS